MQWYVFYLFDSSVTPMLCLKAFLLQHHVYNKAEELYSHPLSLSSLLWDWGAAFFLHSLLFTKIVVLVDIIIGTYNK